ncbi:MAG: hypothetical protein GWP07_04900, partial [Xanthomonadaceae bacterium]|nr:hypothetical protein [Xanthomonadaceae bacterium]
MAKKTKGNLLESLLRYEIILVLFALIGVYYFLTFSPVRMPRQTITSPSMKLPSLPPPASTKKPNATVKQTAEIKSAPSAPTDNQKNLKISETKLPEPTPRSPEVKVMEKKNPVGMKKESLTPPAIPPVKEKATVVTPIEPAPTTTGTKGKAAARQKASHPDRQQPPAAKSPERQTVQTLTTTAPATSGQKSPIVNQPTTTKQPIIVATPRKKSYVIQVGIFI